MGVDNQSLDAHKKDTPKMMHTIGIATKAFRGNLGYL